MENVKWEMIIVKKQILNFYNDDCKKIYSGANECQRGIAIILDKVTANCVTDIQQYNYE